MADDQTSLAAELRRLPPGSPARNETACDLCRTRKVRCRFVDGESACRVCTELDIPCTFNRPRKRRGPLSKHAEAIRVSLSAGGPAGPVPLADYANAIVNSHWLILFAPTATLDRVLDLWFLHIHPVAPILHRRRFMQRLHRGDANTDRTFCGLVVSVCAATVATLPRARPDCAPVTVSYCVEFAERHELLQRQPLVALDAYSLDWCIAMYNFGNALASVAGIDDVRAYHLGSEAAAGVRYLAHYRMPDMGMPEQQLLKRLFWLLFAWSCSADLLGRAPITTLLCEEQLHQMWPLALTDEQLDPAVFEASPLATHLPPWHGDDHSYVPGLQALADLFMVWCRCRQKPPSRVYPQHARELLDPLLDNIQRILDQLPPELRWHGGLARVATATPGHDVQVANIFVTSLHLRANLLQKFAPARCGDAHQRVVDDLLEILEHMPQAIFEANGGSIVPKIRDIGAAYLEHVHSAGPDGRIWVSGVAKDKLESLLTKLDELDLWPGLSGGARAP